VSSGELGDSKTEYQKHNPKTRRKKKL